MRTQIGRQISDPTPIFGATGIHLAKAEILLAKKMAKGKKVIALSLLRCTSECTRQIGEIALVRREHFSRISVQLNLVDDLHPPYFEVKVYCDRNIIAATKVAFFKKKYDLMKMDKLARCTSAIFNLFLAGCEVGLMRNSSRVRLEMFRTRLGRNKHGTSRVLTSAEFFVLFLFLYSA